MSASEIPIPVPPTRPERVFGPRLGGVGRIAGISAWAVIWLICLGVFFLAVQHWFTFDSTPITSYIAQHPQKGGWTDANTQFQIKYQDEIHQMGMSLLFYGGMFAGLRLLACLPYFILSAMILRRRNDRLMVVLFAIYLAVMGAAGRLLFPNWMPLPGLYPWIKIPILLLTFIMNCGAILLYTFPDGRFVLRWTRWLALEVLLVTFIDTFWPNSPVSTARLPGLAGQLPYQLPILIGIFAQIYRYRIRANAEQKQQIKWVVTGIILLMVFYYGHYMVYNTPLLSGLDWTPKLTLIYEMILEPGWYVAQALFAVCIGLSIFRYRLWDIDVVINRVLVYGSLTILTMGIYMGAVVGLGSLFRGVTGPVAFFLVTGLIAILFEPLRRRLQRLVNRLMYGERDEPYSVLTRLSNTLEHSSTPSEMLPAIAETVGQALKIPYVSILIHENKGDHLVARVGQQQEEVLSFQLVYHAEVIGALQVGRRAPGEEFSKADLRLLENIARQAGSAAETIRLNAELVRSRAEIVTTREEERRRLRRDLHDGLGPILASQTLKMAAVRQLVQQNPERAETMLDDMIQQNESTVSEVRRLVYGLRPPALDELGLVEAVRDLIRCSEPGDQSITVEEPEEGLPKLPAAVEANAYRIALEGLTNATRHSKAQHCIIRFAIEDQQHNGEPKRALVVQISDDGAGMPEQYKAGVGIRSMRERAEELGGQLVISPGSPHGTHVSAWLPLVECK